MKHVSSLGPLEQRVMDCLWPDNQKTVRDVYQLLQKERRLAYTTVMTVMTRLTTKGFLSREKAGRAYIYRPRQTKKQAVKAVVGRTMAKLINQFGEEAVAAFVAEFKDLPVKNKEKIAARLRKQPS